MTRIQIYCTMELTYFLTLTISPLFYTRISFLKYLLMPEKKWINDVKFSLKRIFLL